MITPLVARVLIAGILLAGSARAGEAWTATTEPNGAWLTVTFTDGGINKSLWCRASLCADVKIKNAPISLDSFETLGEDRNGSEIVTTYQAAETPYTLVASVGRVAIHKSNRSVSEKPRFTRVTDPQGRYKMRVLPPKED
ncbi:MAG: hypothetical protein Q8T11_07475 [Elusimicrobiota bacterium]|nr:hypothetical protein [Elusimicrobiota bacterium]